MNCIWYVSGFRRPWEAAVIGNLAAAFDTRKFLPKPPQIYVKGGTANLRIEGILSWHSLTFFERAGVVLFKGKLWHLWGDAPFWWGWVRLRARTVHTVLDECSRWKGHPTRLFAEQAREGESVIPPTFEVRVALANDGGEEEARSSTLLLAAQPGEALREALLESEIEEVVIKESETTSSLKRGRCLFVDDAPSNVLLAAYLTMQGVPVVASADTPLLRAVLGPGGYITPRRNAGAEWKEALSEAMSETGRSASAGARRFLKVHYSAAESALALEELYRSVAGGSGGKKKI
jgi:hypothetical protein